METVKEIFSKEPFNIVKPDLYGFIAWYGETGYVLVNLRDSWAELFTWKKSSSGGTEKTEYTVSKLQWGLRKDIPEEFYSFLESSKYFPQNISDAAKGEYPCIEKSCDIDMHSRLRQEIKGALIESWVDNSDPHWLDVVSYRSPEGIQPAFGMDVSPVSTQAFIGDNNYTWSLNMATPKPVTRYFWSKEVARE